ncbi:GNAT family N-acetyltransferase [Burkholderia cenocepacia]|uniref:GNAT family N-acetyltransferase n=1 Tax=Burkholderia cepacia complex TaxID=87882 RepID=UPI001BA1624A|nr:MULTISPECIES: GNAT family N-acetyltransferase [Burkholderia cepacia complex]MBR8041542.1 GNAT family N-acetyltransferase [Burkholderia cenocepacia]MDN7580355.1 GNAT family N-acetyltransferase [Burkholderia orbicola]
MPSSTHERGAQLWRRELSDSLVRPAALPDGLRQIQSDDVSALGQLLFGAFHGTIDDVGHTEAQYALKVTAILGGRYGECIRDASWVVEQTDGLQSACLVCDYKPYGCPVIAVIASAPASQRSGIAGTLLEAALVKLSALGHAECCAMVTKGNVASEHLFRSRGFLPHA